MTRSTFRPFTQTPFTHRHKHLLGNDTRKAHDRFDGLCQAMVIVMALKGYHDPVVQTLLRGGHRNEIAHLLCSENSIEFEKSCVLKVSNPHFQHLLYLLEEVAMKAHPLEVISTFEKMYRLTSNKLSLASHVYDHKESLLIKHEKTSPIINRDMVASILDKCKDQQYVQCSFMKEPSIKNKFNLHGAHATLVFKIDNQFYFFEPNEGVFISDNLLEICDKIDFCISGIYYNLNSAPLAASVIDLTEFLELYMGPQWIKQIQEKTFSTDRKEISEEKNWFSRELSQIMQNSFLHSATPQITLEGEKSRILSLLKCNADPNFICNQQHQTPLDFARYARSDEIQKLLIEFKATVHDEKQQLAGYEDIMEDTNSKQLATFKAIMDSKKYESLADFFKICDFKNDNSILQLYVTKKLTQTFHDYIDSNDSKSVMRFIKNIYPVGLRKVIIDSRDSKDEPALTKIISSSPDEVKLISFLLRNRIDTTLYGPSLNTALITAISKGHLDIAKKILKYSTESINIKNYSGESPVSVAYRLKNFSLFELLVKKGADLPLSLLEDAISNFNYKVISEPDFRKLIQIFEFYAIEKGDYGIILNLRKEGFLEKEEKSSRIPNLIFGAASKGYLELIQLFIREQLIDIDPEDPFSNVMLASQNNHLNVAVELLFNMDVRPGIIKQYLNDDSIKEMISIFIKRIENDSIMSDAEKIQIYQDTIGKHNSFGKLISMLEKPIKIHRYGCGGQLFAPKQQDPFNAIKKALKKYAGNHQVKRSCGQGED